MESIKKSVTGLDSLMKKAKFKPGVVTPKNPKPNLKGHKGKAEAKSKVVENKARPKKQPVATKGAKPQLLNNASFK
jgi:hypothetical protein